MNLHLPQSVEAATELREIAAVPKQLISPRLSKPLIGVVQDTLVGVNRLTRPTEFFTRREFMNLLVHSRRWDGRIPPPAKTDPLPLWSGQQVVSALLPAVYLSMGNKMYDESKGKTDPNYVVIENGTIRQGILDGDVFDKALIHILYNDFSPEMTVDFLDSLQAVVAAYLQNAGFSVGLSDLIADGETLDTIAGDIGDLKKRIESLQLQVHMGLFDNTSGRSNQDEFEGKVFQTLDKSISAAGKTGLRSLAANNRMVNMVKCGSKGSDLNIAQMIALLGQQSIEGRRIAYGFQDRTLPHFKRYDDGAAARGFIESSFVKGLSPAEFFFHAMTGREGLIDTAVKTADSGYMQRKLVKTMEDMMTAHDGSVRDAGGLIVQFAYGDDGTSATKIENQPMPLAKMSDSEIRARFTVPDAAADRSQAYLAALLNDRDMLVRNVWAGRVDKAVQSAVHLPRLIATAIQQLGLAKGQGTPVPGGHVLETIDRIHARTRSDNALWGALLRFYLNPRDLQAAGFTRAAFDWLAEQIVVKHMRSWVVPGEMSGIIAAQSIGEPTTQMSCHKSAIITVGNLKNPEKSYVGQIGEFVDRLMAESPVAVADLGHGSTVMPLPADTWAIMGVSNDERASWRPIAEISRHPANGGMVKVTTKSGRSTTATLTHSFLRRTTTGITEIKGADLTVGDRIPVGYRMPASPSTLNSYKGYALTRDFGWLLGIYLADGSFNGNTVRITKIHPVVEERIRAIAAPYEWPISVKNYSGQYGPGKDTNIHSAELKRVLMELGNTGSFDKRVGAPVFHANADFIAGVISGYFDGDGNINASRQQIRAGSRSEGLIRDMARLLATQGVFATVNEERTVHNPEAVFFTLNVIRKHAAQFQSAIGLYLPEKAAALAEIVAYNARDSAHSYREDLDLIPELGDVIAETGRLLRMPGQSRTYGRYDSSRANPKTAVGRRTLERYIAEFRSATAPTDTATAEKVAANMAILTSAVTSDIIWDEITSLEILPDPHELVYDFTVPGNDSFMVDDNIFVHNTLNSVDWDTEIIIARDGRIWTPQIGEFIDDYIARCKEKEPERIQCLPNEQLYVSLAGDGHHWQALSPDEDGTMKWTTLEAITRHPVVNADGTNTILEVELESGRRVRATKAMSFLRLEGEKIVGCNGSDLKVGDLVPIANDIKVADLPPIGNVSFREVLPATKWLYGTDVAAALATMKAADAAGSTARHWFSHTNGKEFTVPYARSDSFRDAFTKGKNMHAEAIRPGNVYPKKLWTSISQIPETITLDRAFGFFCGAYVAEGNSNATQVMITNNDDTYLAPIRTLLDSWDVGHHTVSLEKHAAKTGIKGHTQSLIIHSTLLAAAMKTWFGRVSYEKTLPDWVFQAPDEFVKGLVDGYVSGDGTVSKSKSTTITISSVSKSLVIRFAMLMARYNLFGTQSEYMPPLGKFKIVSRNYSFTILSHYTYAFAEIFPLTISAKQARLTALLASGKRSYCCRAEKNNVVLDAVKSITEVSPMKEWVYDLTVEETRNFTSTSLVSIKDTFHLSGVAAKSGMTRGVPRLKELLQATQNPKATSLTIYLRPDIRANKEEARRLAQELEFTMLKDLVAVSRIYYDPRDSATLIAEDREWLSFFAAFEADADTDTARSPWLLRLEMDREKMFNKNITMEDISYVLQKAAPESKVIATDHNASRMVFRITFVRPDDKKSAESLDDLTAIKQLQNKLLTQTLIRGLPGLRAVSFRKLDEAETQYEKNPANDNKFEPVQQFVLDTIGTNFLDVLIHPDVDGTRLLSNHIYDIYENLGIEAARQVLFREVFSLFEQAAPVNYRHIALLCDAMTNRGRLMSADRLGVNKKAKIGPLAKASFEMTGDIMLRAALFGEMDPVSGVAANIMTGQPIRGGTSMTQILLDEMALVALTASAPPPRRTVERAPQLVQEQIERILDAPEQPGCRQEDIRIPAALPPMDPTMPTTELPELEVLLVDE